MYLSTRSLFPLMTSRFSAFLFSAADVKLNEPVIRVDRSMIMILLWAMACSASIRTGMPTLRRKVAAEYLAVALLLSRTASIFTPRFRASIRALAIGLLVKEYA